MTEQHDIIAAQRKQISDLLRIIGAHTPIAAFDLATTWQAEKALYQEEIAALELERDALKAELNRSLPDDFATLDEYIRTLHDENTLFTYQSAERGFLLRDMLASGEAHQEWIPLQAFMARIRLVLDSPEDAEKRERAVRAALDAREG